MIDADIPDVMVAKARTQRKVRTRQLWFYIQIQPAAVIVRLG